MAPSVCVCVRLFMHVLNDSFMCMSFTYLSEVFADTHAFIHAYMHTCIHTYVQVTAMEFYFWLSLIHTNTHIYMHAYIHVYIHIHINTYIYVYTHMNACNIIHMYIHTYIHACIHAGVSQTSQPWSFISGCRWSIQTHIYTCMHTYIQVYQTSQLWRLHFYTTHIYTCMHTYRCLRTHSYGVCISLQLTYMVCGHALRATIVICIATTPEAHESAQNRAARF